jgi:hypothetical protein
MPVSKGENSVSYILLKRNKAWLLLLGFLLIITIFFSRTYTKSLITQEPSRSLDSHRNIDTHDLRASPFPEATTQAHTSISTIDSNETEEFRTVMGTAAEAEIVKRWQASHGDPRFMPMEYKSYSIETLQKLSDGGDIYAMQLLADKVQFLTRDGESKAKGLLLRAAVYGSTNALNIQAIHEMHLILDASNELERKARVIDNLVYIKAAALRGDLTHYYRDMTSPVAKNTGSNVTLTEADVKEINDKAVALIDELQKQRMALGLGEFDNSQSPEVKRFLENINPSDLGYKPYF